MIKKLFALASVSALAGLVSAVGAAGCSETEVTPAADGGGTPDSGKKDGGPKTTPDADVEPEPTSCMVKDPIDATQYPYKTPTKSVGACTTEELTKLSAYYKAHANEEPAVSEWSKEVSEKCATCVFSDGEGSTWSPVLVQDDKLANVNRGGCVEILSGKPACGKAYQQVTECRLEACATKCKTQDEFTECLQDGQSIFTGPCKDAYDAMETACGNSLKAAETGCAGKDWTFEGPIKVQCITGGGKADAGDGG
jgi:hypothetical protein